MRVILRLVESSVLTTPNTRSSWLSDPRVSWIVLRMLVSSWVRLGVWFGISGLSVGWVECAGFGVGCQGWLAVSGA